MYNIEFSTENGCKIVRQNLIHNVSKMEGLAESHKDSSFNIKDKYGNIIAGVVAQIIWNWTEVSILWIDENYRKEGLGTMLLKKSGRFRKNE